MKIVFVIEKCNEIILFNANYIEKNMFRANYIYQSMKLQ